MLKLYITKSNVKTVYYVKKSNVKTVYYEIKC